MAFVAYDPGSLASQSRKRLRSLQKYGLPTAQTYQNISEQIAPQENALALQQLQQFAPQLTQLGTQLAGQEQRGGIENDLAAILGPGKDLANQALQLDMLTNPQFYGMREQAGQGLSALLGAQDPARLSGAELAETERGLNRLNSSRGNINVTDATTTAANAEAFGDKLAAKQARFAQSLALIPSLSAASRSPIDAFGIATGKNNTANPLGAGNVSTGTQVGQGIDSQMQDTYKTNQQIRAGAPTGLSQVNESFKAVGSVCGCYIFKEHYGYPEIPAYLKWVRDYEYKKNPAIGAGYRRMAYWLVPLMQRYSIIRHLVAWFMIFPLLFHAGYRTGYNRWGRVFWPFKWFWLRVWGIKLRRYGCTGWRLCSIGPWLFELWFCPPRSTIPSHTHKCFDSYIVHIWGTALVCKDKQRKLIPPFTMFKLFKIPAEMVHGFLGFQNWFVFLNIERWKKGSKTSACVDLTEV